MLPRLYNTLASFKSARLGGCIHRIGGHVSGRAAVHSAVPVSAGLAKPAVVAVPVHRVTDRRAKCTPEQSHFAEHLARRPRFRVSSATRTKLPIPLAFRWPGTRAARLLPISDDN